MRNQIKLPVASHSNSIDSFYTWLKQAVAETPYGEIGLHFIIHNGDVIRVKKHIEISCKAANE